MSYRKILFFAFLISFLVISLSSSLSAELRKRVLPEKPKAAIIPPGYDRHHIEVKFLDEMSIGLTAEGSPFDRQGALLKSSRSASVIDMIAESGSRWRRTTGNQEQKIAEMVSVAESFHNREIANLNNYFILTVPEGVRAEDWINELNAMPEVEIAQPLPLPMKLPFWANYVPFQGYLNPAPDGIDARYAWVHGGGAGELVSICDFEYSWNLAHYDFDTSYTNYATIFPIGYTYSDPFNDKRHGTAVLGELISMRGFLGTTGGVYNTQIKVAPTYLDDHTGGGPAWLLGDAMNNAMTMGGIWSGDVMLIEQQIAGPNWTGSSDTGLVPIEWYEPWYNIVLTATGNGIHVVECAGNGYQNLDDAVYNTGHAPFNVANHSRAIIVGAGAAPAMYGGSDVDRSRLNFSNYGSRVDLQGWGEMVITTGYGVLYNEHPDSNWDYTNIFSGTSSAAPIVASAVAAVESIYQWRDPMGMSTPFGVDTVRNLLKNTGTPQQSGTYPASQNIGPRPNLKQALSYVISDQCDFYKKSQLDYAPAGVPDFDQLQRTNWRLPDGRWTHSGPVALADCFWWFDAKFD
ncbi:MAG: S8 family serine peptidase, partial [Candidatus Zixiibacteriota bacterium]